MGITRRWVFVFWLLSICLDSYSEGMAMDNYSRSSLDDVIRENALQALEGQRTGVLYNIPLPSNLSLSGIESRAVRLKSGSFWSRGANFSNVDIPPGCIATPFATRIAIVYQLLRNSSANTYYNVPGYVLATPVIGFFAYNATNVNGRVARNVGLMLTKDPISVRFLDVSPPGELNSSAKCARFEADGSMYLSDITLPFVCVTRNQGHFSIVVPLMAPTPTPAPAPAPAPAQAPSAVTETKKGSKWTVSITACVCGGVGLVLLGLLGFEIFKFVKRKKLVQMERKAEEGESLGNVWVGGSRMPSAAFMRTQPTLETENIP